MIGKKQNEKTVLVVKTAILKFCIVGLSNKFLHSFLWQWQLEPGGVWEQGTHRFGGPSASCQTLGGPKWWRQHFSNPCPAKETLLLHTIQIKGQPSIVRCQQKEDLGLPNLYKITWTFEKKILRVFWLSLCKFPISNCKQMSFWCFFMQSKWRCVVRHRVATLDEVSCY